MKYLISIIVVIIFCTSCTAQILNNAEIEERMDSLFHRFNSKSSPGIAITVFQNDKVITRKNYGSANLEHGIPFKHQSPVRLVYSFGREFICVGAALMEAEGLLRFDDKVRTYFPKLPDWSKDVTIQDLLNHSSGFVDEWSLYGFVTEDMRSSLTILFLYASWTVLYNPIFLANYLGLKTRYLLILPCNTWC